MTQYERSIDVNRSAEDVFEYLGDIIRLPEYFPQITSVEQLEEDKIRTTAHIEPPGQPAQDVEGEAMVPGAHCRPEPGVGIGGAEQLQGRTGHRPQGFLLMHPHRPNHHGQGRRRLVEDGLAKAVRGIADTLQNA